MQNNGWNIRPGKMVRFSDIKKTCKSSTVCIAVEVFGTTETQMNMKMKMEMKMKDEPFFRRTQSAVI